MTNITLSDGQVVNPAEITKVTLWANPTRLQIDLKDENRMPLGVYNGDPRQDADLLDKVRDEEHLTYLVFRDGI
jgi:hypothetical protein